MVKNFLVFQCFCLPKASKTQKNKCFFNFCENSLTFSWREKKRVLEKVEKPFVFVRFFTIFQKYFFSCFGIMASRSQTQKFGIAVGNWAPGCPIHCLGNPIRAALCRWRNLAFQNLPIRAIFENFFDLPKRNLFKAFQTFPNLSNPS